MHRRTFAWIIVASTLATASVVALGDEDGAFQDEFQSVAETDNKRGWSFLNLLTGKDDEDPLDLRAGMKLGDGGFRDKADEVMADETVAAWRFDRQFQRLKTTER
jgi:hypothetical protein